MAKRTAPPPDQASSDSEKRRKGRASPSVKAETPEKKGAFNGHLWISSVGVILALFLSGITAWYGWKTIEIKEEKLSILASPTVECVLQVEFLENGLVDLSMCWDITLINQSESTVSIISVFPIEVLSDVVMLHGGEVKGTGGEDYSLPFSIEAGGARKFVLTTPTMVDIEHGRRIKKFYDDRIDQKEKLKLFDLEQHLLSHNLSLLGGAVEVSGEPGNRFAEKSAGLPVVARHILAVGTGQDSSYEKVLDWPQLVGDGVVVTMPKRTKTLGP